MLGGLVGSWILLYYLFLLPALELPRTAFWINAEGVMGLVGFGLLLLTTTVLNGRILTLGPERILPVRMLAAGPEGSDSYAEVDLGGIGTRIRIKAAWPRFSRVLHLRSGETAQGSAER